MPRKAKWQNDYISRTYDRLQVLPKKEEGQQIREAAAAAGESVNEYILKAVQDRMKREESKDAQL